MSEKLKNGNLNLRDLSIGIKLEPNIIFADNALLEPAAKYDKYYARFYWKDEKLFKLFNETIDTVVKNFKALLLNHKDYKRNPNLINNMLVKRPWINEPPEDSEYKNYSGYYTFLASRKDQPIIYNGVTKKPLNLNENSDWVKPGFTGGVFLTIYPYATVNIGVTCILDGVWSSGPVIRKNLSREILEQKVKFEFTKCDDYINSNDDDDEDIPF